MGKYIRSYDGDFDALERRVVGDFQEIYLRSLEQLAEFYAKVVSIYKVEVKPKIDAEKRKAAGAKYGFEPNYKGARRKYKVYNSIWSDVQRDLVRKNLPLHALPGLQEKLEHGIKILRDTIERMLRALSVYVDIQDRKFHRNMALVNGIVTLAKMPFSGGAA